MDDIGIDSDHLQATRDGTPGGKDASYIMVYHPILRRLTVDTSVISGQRLRCWWYDPRNGEARLAGEIDNAGELKRPWDWHAGLPALGPDWVLVIDDAARNYAAPGQ